MATDKTMIHGFDIQLEKIWTLLQTIEYFKTQEFKLLYQDKNNNWSTNYTLVRPWIGEFVVFIEYKKVRAQKDLLKNQEVC